MYIKVGSRIINTEAIVEARVSPAIADVATTIQIVTTADYTIDLVGDEADAFLQALPTYEPVPDPADAREETDDG